MNITDLNRRAARIWAWATGMSHRLWRAVTLPQDPHAEPPGWLNPAVGVLLGISALAAVFLLIIPGVAAIVSGVRDWLAGGADWLRTSDLAGVVLDPVRAYLSGHNQLRPEISDDTLWWSWGAFGVASFALSCLFRNVGARIGWALWGAATAAMVWIEHPAAAGRPVAAGFAVAWWCAFTVLAYRRRWSPPRVVSLLPQFRSLDRWLDHREKELERRVARSREPAEPATVGG